MAGKYYRASSAYLGDKTVIEPSGLYEAIDKEGYPIEEKYGGGYHASDVLETAASKHKQGAILGGYSMVRYAGKPLKTTYLYEIEDKPDVDISWWDEADFAHLGEVRYRKPVQAKFIGTYTYTAKDKDKFNALYRLLDEENPIENEKTYKRLKGKVVNIDKYLFNEVPKRIEYSRDNKGAWATEFMEGYNQMGKVNFMDKRDRLIDGVSVNLSDYEENDKVIKVWTITAMVRGQGGGSKVLEKLKALADETKTSIVLKPGAWGLAPVLTVPQLKEWYMRHGFKEMKNGWLIYKPKGVTVKVNLEKHLGTGFWAKRAKRKASTKPRAGRIK
jgi:hypothetical protein